MPEEKHVTWLVIWRDENHSIQTQECFSEREAIAVARRHDGTYQEVDA